MPTTGIVMVGTRGLSSGRSKAGPVGVARPMRLKSQEPPKPMVVCKSCHTSGVMDRPRPMTANCKKEELYEFHVHVVEPCARRCRPFSAAGRHRNCQRALLAVEKPAKSQLADRARHNRR